MNKVEIRKFIIAEPQKRVFLLQQYRIGSQCWGWEEISPDGFNYTIPAEGSYR